MQVQKSVNNSRSKKGKKNAATSEEALSNASCNSEDESTASQELNECSSSSAKGKRRAGRGSATDPQSLYARVCIDSDSIQSLDFFFLGLCLLILFLYF